MIFFKRRKRAPLAVVPETPLEETPSVEELEYRTQILQPTLVLRYRETKAQRDSQQAEIIASAERTIRLRELRYSYRMVRNLRRRAFKAEMFLEEVLKRFEGKR